MANLTDNVLDFRTLPHIWVGVQWYTQIAPKMTSEVKSESVSSIGTNLKYIDDTAGVIMRIIDDINGEVI
jgi:hypothetical protein